VTIEEMERQIDNWCDRYGVLYDKHQKDANQRFQWVIRVADVAKRGARSTRQAAVAQAYQYAKSLHNQRK